MGLVWGGGGVGGGEEQWDLRCSSCALRVCESLPEPDFHPTRDKTSLAQDSTSGRVKGRSGNGKPVAARAHVRLPTQRITDTN